MTNKAKKLNELVEAIPGVCAGGRDGIRNLVAEITGEILVEITYAQGQRFEYSRSAAANTTRKDIYLLTSGGPCEVQATNTRTGDRRGSPVRVKNKWAITKGELQSIFSTRFPERIIKVVP